MPVPGSVTVEFFALKHRLFLLYSGFLPKDCIVVEDSVPGIKAVIAAKMTVIGFLGGSHTQYDWYEKNIKFFNIPTAKNDLELLNLVNSFTD